MSDATEATALLLRIPNGNVKPHQGWFNPYRRVLLATLLLSTTFWFTATPIVYSFRLFNCEEYYADPAHPMPGPAPGDACAVPAIEASTSRDLSFMGMVTAFSGTLNLLLTTWQIRHWGLRSALVQQTFWPALRNLTQIYATHVGGRTAITIMQLTQLITILGGGLGYNLAANSYITELVAPDERTAAFGVLAGINMLGTAIGYIAGGIAGERFSLSAPWEITFCLLVGSTIFTRTMLPYIPPTFTSAAESAHKPAGILSAFSALAVFRPVAYLTQAGTKKWYYGLTLLAFGAFAGSLATGYVPLMLQLTATNQYAYKTAENGYLMASLSLSRAIFLTFAFPAIIKAGRKWYSPVEAIPATTDGADAATDKMHGSKFDLVFLQWSMVIDAVLTSLVAFSSRAWHINLAAVVLPLASGTAPACKGVLMDMIPTPTPSPGEPGEDGSVNEEAARVQRADALAGISIIETFAWISTIAIFGQLFALLSALERPNLVFFCNAGLAMGAAAVLFAVRFPPGARR
ncbi:hypothetical protein C8F01DRAFT_1162059 [Mycena amicta]|nr:hypothetical protein C8F01DRAFT_1162059 [Mycena amicta]